MTNGKYAFVYDANGNVMEKGNTFAINGDQVTFTTSGSGVQYWKYGYDLLNRLMKVEKYDEAANTLVEVTSYAYDESGLRVRKTGGGSTIDYVFDLGGNLLFEKKNNRFNAYIYVIGKHFARIDGTVGGSERKIFYHTDHLGSTTMVTDDQGNKLWEGDYTPFGEKIVLQEDPDDFARFTGKDFDEDIGLYYFNARWYDAELGRFVEEDSYKGDPNDPRTLNYYMYCMNRPIVMTDPDGRHPILEILFSMCLGATLSPPEASPKELAINMGTSVLAGRAGSLVKGGGIVKIGLRGAVEGATYSLTNQYLKKGEVDWREFFRDTALGAVINVGVEGLGRINQFYKASKAAVKTGEVSTKEMLEILATKVDVEVGGPSTALTGTYKHSMFKKEIDQIFGDSSLIKTERSFIKGRGEVQYGTKCSVRVDVIEYNVDGSVKAIYDLKTGKAGLNEARRSQIREAVGVADDVPVIEIRSLPTPKNTASTVTKVSK